MSLRALIVDDEELGRERIRLLLQEFPNVSVCGECAGGEDAVTVIRADSPDLVFLDIQMPDLDGFGVIAKLRSEEIPVPVVVFVTAYNEHAVQAFEVNAIDYLLKPVQAQRLGKAIERVTATLEKPSTEAWQENLAQMLSSVPTAKFLHRIEIRSQGRTDYVNVDDVYWLQADGNYIEVHTATETYLARITLAELESQLDPDAFLRIGRSAVVNLARVRSVESVGRRGHQVILEDGSKVPLKRALDELQKRMRYS